MELNFNSVEMSRKPNAEASSLGYAEVPLTFNSVETIHNFKASAAFLRATRRLHSAKSASSFCLGSCTIETSS